MFIEFGTAIAVEEIPYLRYDISMKAISLSLIPRLKSTVPVVKMNFCGIFYVEIGKIYAVSYRYWYKVLHVQNKNGLP